MGWTNRRLRLIILAFLLAATGCNYPGFTAPTPFPFEPPTATVTRVINPNPGGMATMTAAASATSSPQAGSVATATTTAPPLQATMPVPTATSSPPASATQAPTRSEAGPGKRGEESLVATFLRAEPSINGELGDWPLDRYRVEDVVYGRENWKGVDDLSARVMFAWDLKYLYVGARVIDERYVQEAEGEDLYRGDSLEFVIDRDVPGDYYRQAMDQDDFQIGVSPGEAPDGAGAQAYLWQPRNLEGDLPQVEIGTIWVDGAYKIEVAIPWSLLGVEPKNGLHLGFAFSVSDNDRAGEAVQQTMISTAPRRVYNDPTTWGDLVLAGR